VVGIGVIDGVELHIVCLDSCGVQGSNDRVERLGGLINQGWAQGCDSLECIFVRPIEQPEL
jgi:hypothetical protein